MILEGKSAKVLSCQKADWRKPIQTELKKPERCTVVDAVCHADCIQQIHAEEWKLQTARISVAPTKEVRVQAPMKIVISKKPQKAVEMQAVPKEKQYKSVKDDVTIESLFRMNTP